MKKIILLIGILFATSLIANHRSDAENKCRSQYSDKRATCREVCFNEHNKDSTYSAMNRCQYKCNIVSNKCKDSCIPV